MTERFSRDKPAASKQQHDSSPSESAERTVTSTLPSSGIMPAATAADAQPQARAQLDVTRPDERTTPSLVARRDGRTLRRMTIYLPHEVAHRLRVYCAENDQPISRVVTDAVRRVIGA